jgi:nucleotide-binding universal stress UspA family protein
MYTNILVPVSFDEERDAAQAVKVAQTLAGDGAKITLFHVIEQIPAYALTQVSQGYLDTAKTAVQEGLGRLAAGADNIETAIVEGHAGRALLDFAREKAMDCIVVASHRPGLQDYFLGSTASHVVRHASCSVHVLR